MKLDAILLSLVVLVIRLPSVCEPLEGANDIRCSKLKSNGCSPTGEKVLTFGLLLSFPDPLRRPDLISSFDDGHNLAPAAYLAVDQVNKRRDILKDYTVKLSRFDGGCDVMDRTITGYNELICSCDSIMAVIGPSCEKSSQMTSKLTNREQFTMVTVNYAGSTEAVGNHDYAFGLLGTSSIYNRAVDQLIKSNSNWTSPALLYSGSEGFFSDHSEELQTIANHSGYRFRYVSAIYDTFIPLSEVRSSFSRIIVINASPLTIIRVLCMAYHEGMVFPTYQWIFPEVIAEEFKEVSFVYDNVNYSCSHAEIAESLNGNINLFLSAFSTGIESNTTTDAGVTLREYEQDYQLQTKKYSKEFGVTSNFSRWARGVYDTVWTLAFALNESVVDFNHSLTEFRPGSRRLAESIRERMLHLDIVGVTGRINFDELGYNHQGILNIYQYFNQNSTSISMKKIATYKNSQIVFVLNANFTDGSFTIVYVQINPNVAIGIFVATTLALIFTVSAQIVNICYRNNKVIKASSPILNHLIFLGCYMIVVGITFYVLETFQTTIDVVIRTWFANFVPCLLNIGVTLILGTVAIKTWRLNRIYTSSKKLLRGDIKCIKNHFLVGFVIIFISLDIVVCISWHCVDSAKPSRTDWLGLLGSKPTKFVKENFESNYSIYWLTALMIPKVILTLASFLLALSTHMNIKEFKTINVIILTYFLTIIYGLGIPMYIVFYFKKVEISVTVVLVSVCLNTSVYLSLLFLFLPLIRSHFKSCVTLCKW